MPQIPPQEELPKIPPPEQLARFLRDPAVWPRELKGSSWVEYMQALEELRQLFVQYREDHRLSGEEFARMILLHRAAIKKFDAVVGRWLGSVAHNVQTRRQEQIEVMENRFLSLTVKRGQDYEDRSLDEFGSWLYGFWMWEDWTWKKHFIREREKEKRAIEASVERSRFSPTHP